jgi:hypothetical protein
MKPSVRVIKQNREEQPKESTTPQGEKSVERSTREMVSTVKSWIVELQQRKRLQCHSFVPLPVIATAAANQKT